MKRLLLLVFVLALAAVACGSPASTATSETVPSATAEPVLGAVATQAPSPEATGEAAVKSFQAVLTAYEILKPRLEKPDRRR